MKQLVPWEKVQTQDNKVTKDKDQNKSTCENCKLSWVANDTELYNTTYSEPCNVNQSRMCTLL